MKVKPVKIDKEMFKYMVIEENIEFREYKSADGTLLGMFPKSFNYNLTFSDKISEFQWIKMHKGKLLKVKKE